MKNRYEIIEDTVMIYLPRSRGSDIVTLIDVDALPIVHAHEGTWFPYYNRTSHSYYVKTNTSKRARVEGPKSIRMHRIIMNAPKGMFVDHINHDTLDNRRSNLRIVTLAENQQNRKGAQRNNKGSGIRGVYPHQGKWVAAIHINGRKKYLGIFNDIEDAAVCSEQARQRYMPFSLN